MNVRQLAAIATSRLEQTIAGCRAGDDVEVQRARDLLRAIADESSPRILALMLGPVVNMGETLMEKGGGVE